MADPVKRSLRERRAPRNFDSDIDEQDPFGYAKPTYSRPVSQQELRNSSHQNISDAKLLIQFLNNINKKLKYYVAAHPKAQTSDTKETVAQQEKKGKASEGGSSGQQGKGEVKQTKIDHSKRADGPHSIRAQNNGVPISYSKSDSLLSQYIARNAESAHKMLDIEKSLKYKHPSSELNHSRLQRMKLNTQPDLLNNSKKQQIIAKNSIKTTPTSETQTAFLGISKENTKQNEDDSNTKTNNKPAISDNKIFKRSAYHVAIAYHIYIRNMREKGAQGNEIDPTYSARKLKESLLK